MTFAEVSKPTKSFAEIGQMMEDHFDRERESSSSLSDSNLMESSKSSHRSTNNSDIFNSGRKKKVSKSNKRKNKKSEYSKKKGKNRGHIDKPKSPYISCCVQTSYVKTHFYTQFHRGMVLEISGHVYLDDETTSSQRGGNGGFLRHFAVPWLARLGLHSPIRFKIKDHL